MNTIFAPERLSSDLTFPSIFLAGSIEMGKAERWQDKLIQELKDHEGTILNPRRKEWDASWKQSIDNPVFKEQVRWEILAIKYADIVVFYFDPTTFSPITFYELGYVLRRNPNSIVCCPDGFWRQGNIEVYCEMEGVILTKTWESFVEEIKKTLALTIR